MVKITLALSVEIQHTECGIKDTMVIEDFVRLAILIGLKVDNDTFI